jgi:branched-chain amino acid transport system permease protein
MSARLALPLAILIAAALPVVPGIPPFWITLLNNIGLAALVALGLVLLTGVGGLTSFGQAAFCGFAAYTSALLTTRYGASPWLTLPVSLLVTGVAALVLGVITVRLSGHYLPLGTIAWGLSIYYLFGQIEMLGRHDGLTGIPPLTFFGISLREPKAIYYAIWFAVFAASICTIFLLDSRIGRAMRSLRGGRVAAESFGINTARLKLIAFVYAAVLAGLSGWLYAHYQRTVNPTPFGLHIGIEYLFMAVLGGAGYVWGAVTGAALVTLLEDVLQRVSPMLVGNFTQIDTIVFGVLLVLTLQFAPRGVWAFLRNLGPKPRPREIPKAEPLARREAGAIVDGPLLSVSGLRKQFGGLVAVNDVSFSLKSGEIVALIGPNGAGKSTTFNLISGVARPTSGAVKFNGHDLSKANAQDCAKLGMARTFQHVKLLPEMTVLENVALGAHLRGKAGLFASMFRLDRTDEAKLLAEAARQIERVGLAEHMHKPAGSLALGQQRIVEIARALCLDPQLLLLDEPAAGLRHFEKQGLAKLLDGLRQEGMSILLVEHDMGFVMGLTDHIVVLDFGSKIAEGKPEAIRQNPAVLQAYLGSDA